MQHSMFTLVHELPSMLGGGGMLTPCVYVDCLRWAARRVSSLRGACLRAGMRQMVSRVLAKWCSWCSRNAYSRDSRAFLRLLHGAVRLRCCKSLQGLV